MFTLLLVHYTNIITSAKNKQQLQLSLMEMSVVTEVTNKFKYFAQVKSYWTIVMGKYVLMPNVGEIISSCWQILLWSSRWNKNDCDGNKYLPAAQTFQSEILD